VSAAVCPDVQAAPFPHCIIENILTASEVRAINEEWPDNGWIQHYHKHARKRGCREWAEFGAQTRAAILRLNAAQFVKDIAGAFGLTSLTGDGSLYGGGLHETMVGGFLDVHADFNVHPETRYVRRLNLLLFLNEDWREEWGGALELWDREACSVRILPEAGRCVMFAANDSSFHGHPQPLACSPDQSRRSLALYYYSPARPGEEIRRHSTLYRGEEATWFADEAAA